MPPLPTTAPPGNYPPGDEPCATGVPISGPTGLMVVTDTGQVDVVARGINYGDQYRTIVQGRLRLTGDAFLAADHGTGVELRPHTTSRPGTGTLPMGSRSPSPS